MHLLVDHVDSRQDFLDLWQKYALEESAKMVLTYSLFLVDTLDLAVNDAGRSLDAIRPSSTPIGRINGRF